MKISKFVASLMLSTTMLSVATPVLADQVKQDSTTTVKTEKTNSSEKASSSATNSSATDSTSAEENKNEPIQTLKEQKMIIKKIVAKGGSQMAMVSENNKSDGEKAPGIAQSDYQGVPNSKFVIYDVTDLMETVTKEKLGVSDEKAQRALDAASSKEDQENEKAPMSATQKAASELKSETSKDPSDTKQGSSSKVAEESVKKVSENSAKEKDAEHELVEKVKELRQGDTLRKTISERAAKLNKDQLKVVTEVTTDDQGKAEVTLPIDGKYHAYYVVNTETAKKSYATNSSPIVVITPVADSEGDYAVDFTIYPKSDTIEKEQPTKETTATMYQTGHKSESLLAKIKEWIANLF